MFVSGLNSFYFDGILYTVIICGDKLILYTGNIYDDIKSGYMYMYLVINTCGSGKC
jgi:hypothetical protein